MFLLNMTINGVRGVTSEAYIVKEDKQHQQRLAIFLEEGEQLRAIKRVYDVL